MNVSFHNQHIRQHIIKSYSCRGRATNLQKASLQSAEKQLLSPTTKLTQQWSWSDNNRKLCVELGCGGGENLLHMAKNYPHWAFVGADVYVPGVGKLLNQASNVTNLKVLHGDHQLLFSNCLVTTQISVLMLLFPDPWPKNRHHKRRLINQQFLSLVAERIKPGGQLWIATDWHNYAEHIIALLAQNPIWQPAKTSPPLTRTTTAFEKKALVAARRIFEQRWQLMPNATN